MISRIRHILSILTVMLAGSMPSSAAVAGEAGAARAREKAEDAARWDAGQPPAGLVSDSCGGTVRQLIGMLTECTGRQSAVSVHLT